MDQNENWKLEELPLPIDVETKAVLKSLPSAHAALAELKGIASTIPNQIILINTLGLQEAKDSSAIENIITTHDDLFKSELNLDSFKSLEAKEVQNYISALKKGFELIQSKGFITNSVILEIQKELEGNNAGFRKLPGTSLKNSSTGETIYTPPQDFSEINRLMSNLEKFMNDPSICDYDPIVKMAIIHYQFESIHPFYDGNGRTGRIINILYLVLKQLLDSPILYLSSYIIKNKSEYYKLLQEVRIEQNWEAWIVYILKGVEQTSSGTLKLVKNINMEVEIMSREIKERLPKIYSKELLDLLFYEFYTKIVYIEKGLFVTRKTAAGYLSSLEKEGFLTSEKIGKERIYKNNRLYDLVTVSYTH